MINDIVLNKPSVISLQEYIETQQKESGGTITDYTAPNGVQYKIWNVENLGYEAFYTFFYTEYEDENGYHIVEASTFKSSFEESERLLKPLVDSIRLPG